MEYETTIVKIYDILVESGDWLNRFNIQDKYYKKYDKHIQACRVYESLNTLERLNVIELNRSTKVRHFRLKR